MSVEVCVHYFEPSYSCYFYISVSFLIVRYDLRDWNKRNETFDNTFKYRDIFGIGIKQYDRTYYNFYNNFVCSCEMRKEMSSHFTLLTVEHLMSLSVILSTVISTEDVLNFICRRYSRNNYFDTIHTLTFQWNRRGSFHVKTLPPSTFC